MPASASPSLRLATAAVVPERATHAAMVALAVLLGGVYVEAGLTLPAGHGVLAIAEIALGAAQLAFAAAVALSGGGRGILRAGGALQALLLVLWLVSRATGRLPVGELDLFCAADALMVLALAVGPARTLRRSLATCQVAAMLLGTTAFAWGGGHMHHDGPAGQGGQVAALYCHLL